MTLFETIILVLMYTFCFTFSIVILTEAVYDKFDRVIFFLLMLVLSPLFAMIVLGVYVASIITDYIYK